MGACLLTPVPRPERRLCPTLPGAAVLAVVPELALVSLGGGGVAWKLFYLLRMLRMLRLKRLARAVWGAALSCGPGGRIEPLARL